jgi:hypothetical protein
VRVVRMFVPGSRWVRRSHSKPRFDPRLSLGFP